MDRAKKIIQTSLIGVGVNILLAAFKALVGAVSGSIAIILDAINNLSDAFSSVVTIIGTKLAGKAPDKQHPYGHGRIEYLTAVLISVVIILTGLASLKESVMKIIEPQEADYSVWSLLIIGAAVAAKLFIGRYFKAVGRRINADTLVASGSDAFFDSILSLGTLVGAIVSMIWDISLEGILGAVISLFIVKAGAEILRDTLQSIIGARADSEVSERVKETLGSHDEVRGVYDLALHNYGPTQLIGSVHIEVADEMTAREIHKLTRQLAAEVFAEMGIVLTVGIYSSNGSSAEAAAIRESAEKLAEGRQEVLQLHGFYADVEQKAVMFDLIVDFRADGDKVRREIAEELCGVYPGYRFDIVLDSDYSD